MILAHENKCAMCGKDTIISREHGRKKEKEDQQLQENNSISTIIIEQINGSSYIFDTANCQLIFKKFREVYGSNFADE